jgi:hypothetical protein
VPIQVTFKSNIPAIVAGLDEVLDETVQVQAKELHDKIDAAMMASGGGRVYRLGSKKRGYTYHTASAPGDAPAIGPDSDPGGGDDDEHRKHKGHGDDEFPGHYIDSIKDGSTGPLTAAVWTDELLGVFLELGTRRHLEPRPHFAPAIEKQRDEFYTAIAEATLAVLEDAEL